MFWVICMKKHLIVLDLDGTLLYDWETLTEDTCEYLKALQTEGHTLVIATGRPYRSSIFFYEQLGLNTPMINYNGGLITWKSNPDFEEVNIPLDRDAVNDVFAKNRKRIENAFCEIKDDIYLLEESEDIRNFFHFNEHVNLYVGEFSGKLPAGTNGCIIMAKEKEGRLIEEYVEKHYKDIIKTRNWGNDYESVIELYSPKTNKGIAIKHVAKHLGFDRDSIIAFGDGHNDIEMLEYAGVGVAMGNAHEELKEVADVISPKNHQERAIEHFLDNYFQKKKVDSD